MRRVAVHFWPADQKAPAYAASTASQRLDLAAAQRLLVELADGPVPLAAEVAEDRRRAPRLATRLAKRLAHLARHLARDLLDTVVDHLGHLREQVPALRRRQARPGRERLLRRCNRVVDVPPVAGRELAHDL